MGKISDALERYRKEKKGTLESPPARAFTVPKSEERLEDGGPVRISSGEYHGKLVVSSAPDSPDAENFKILRAKLLFPSSGVRPKSIMVTSTFPGEGKSYVASNLAASIALGIDEHVLVVDCDLRQPHLHEIFEQSGKEGLHEYLIGEKSLSDVIIRTNVNKLSLIPAGRLPANPTELLSSSRMLALLEEVKERYEDRYVIIDSTPSLVTAEANILAKHVDGIVLVIMAQKTPRKAVEKTIQNLGKDGIMGVVFNGYSKVHREYRRYYKKYYRSE